MRPVFKLGIPWPQGARMQMSFGQVTWASYGWRPGHPFHDGNPNIHDVYPICSMYGIFTNICPKNNLNVGKYTIHGAYGYIHIHPYEFMTVLRRISALHPSFHHGTMVDLLESKNVGKVGENHVDMSPRSSMLHAVPYIAGCFEFKCTWMRLNISCMHETSCIRTPQSGPICHPLILVS